MENLIKIILVDINKIKDDFLNISFINEKDKIDALKYKKIIDQKQHIISSYLKRKYVKDYYLDKYKKPKSNSIFFNISHSQNLVGIAISNVEVGLDIEYKNKEIKDNLINYVCNNAELKFIKDESDFYKIWTSKESLLKCIGIGIINNMKDVNSIPLCGIKEYNNELFYSNYIDYFNYSISVTIKGNKNFKLELIEEDVYGKKNPTI